MIKNLEQIRAKNALDATAKKIFQGQEGGEVAEKVPAQIITNGFLGALAFAIDKKNRKKNEKSKDAPPSDDEGEGYSMVFKEIMKHLGELKLCKETENIEVFAREMCNVSSDKLRAVTAEAMAYLSYFRRFAKKAKAED